ncbi:hypothetical protein B0H34DRAFT_862201 [Crassisporium funariophilum]|nr:hypothetical protein B0H34DRAFT_862201 [Crassisporium funariophilum]
MGKKAKKSKQPGFTVDSTQYCDVCKRNIAVGLGGEWNWEVHTTSAAHQKAALKTATMPKKTLLSFFTKASSISAASAGSSQAVDVPSPLLSRSRTAFPLTANGSVASPPINASLVQVPRPISSPDMDIPLLQELHRAIFLLPLNVLPGIPSDPLAIFAHPPTAFLKADQDAWEDIVNPALDCVLGFCANTESICSVARTAYVVYASTQVLFARSLSFSTVMRLRSLPSDSHAQTIRLPARYAHAWHLSNNVTLYKPIFRFHANEEKLIKVEWKKLKHHQMRVSKETSTRTLNISDGHSLRLALRDLDSEELDL